MTLTSAVLVVLALIVRLNPAASSPCNPNPCEDGQKCIGNQHGGQYKCLCPESAEDTLTIEDVRGSAENMPEQMGSVEKKVCETLLHSIVNCTVTDDIRKNGTLPYINNDGLPGNTSNYVLLKTGDKVTPGTTIYVDECTPCQCTNQGNFNCTPIDSGWNSYSQACLLGHSSIPCVPNNATWSYPGDNRCYRHTCVNGKEVDLDLTQMCTCDNFEEKSPIELSQYPVCCFCVPS